MLIMLIKSKFSTNQVARRATRSKEREGGKGSDAAEHVIISLSVDELKVVGTYRVVVHKQLASEGFVVEVAGEVSEMIIQLSEPVGCFICDKQRITRLVI